MKDSTFEQNHILYLVNEEKNIYSLIGNTLDFVKTRTIPEIHIHSLKNLYESLEELEKNAKPKPSIFSQIFSSLFGKKPIDNKEPQIKCNLIDNLQKLDNKEIENIHKNL